MSKFERKFGKYAVKNLSLMLIMCYAVGYMINIINPQFLLFLTLNPHKILGGQIWRLITWIIVPPDSSNLFFVLIMLYFYYSIGTTLERTWGTYRYNVYLFSGMLFTILGAFLLMGYVYIFMPDRLAIYGAEQYFAAIATVFSTYYVNMSIFLAFAATFPEAQVLLMFIIPIKIKWMGIVYGILLIVQVIQGEVFTKFAIAASLMNFLVFWITSKSRVSMSPKQVKRRQEFKRAVKKSAGVTKHKCAICGRTEEECPDMEFRFCSKCDGNYEYCQEHLFTHQHVKHH